MKGTEGTEGIVGTEETEVVGYGKKCHELIQLPFTQYSVLTN